MNNPFPEETMLEPAQEHAQSVGRELFCYNAITGR